MNRMLVKGLIVFIAVIIVVGGITATADAQAVPANPITRDLTLVDLGYTSDDTVTGVRVTRDYRLDWPDAWVPQPGNIFTLRFSHSPTLNPRSTLTIEFNFTHQLTSVPLTPENAENGSLEIALPEDVIRAGFNRLRLEFYMGIDDFNCQDLENPAVWATIHTTSTFHLSYTLKTPEPDLADFPTPLIDNSALVENHVTFILPDHPTPAELNAAAAISAKLGQLAAWRTIYLHTLSETQARNPEGVEGDLIVVGRADRLQMLKATPPPFVSWQDGRPVLVNITGEPLPLEAGVLWAQPSLIDETNVMFIVTGATDDAVVTAGRALASEVSYPHLAGRLGVVLSVPEPASIDTSIGQVVTLEELSYQDRTGWGTQEQSIGYTVSLPLAWQVRSEATFDLHFAHSATADFENASLTVLLNNTPVGNALLTSENAVEGRATFRLPARLFKSGDNSLVVTSDIDVADDRAGQRDCLDPDPEKRAWLVVYADSQLNLPGGPTDVPLSLADYPRTFIGPANLSDFAFIVPESVDVSYTHAILQIAERLGHFAKGEALAPRVIDTQTLESIDQPPGHQILIGRPSQNVAIARLNDVLPQPFKLWTDDPQRVKSLVQVVPLKETIGYVQAVSSPEGQPRLVVTGTTDEGVLWASEALSNPDLMKKLSGNLAILSTKGSVATADIRTAEARQTPQPSITKRSVPVMSSPTATVEGQPEEIDQPKQSPTTEQLLTVTPTSTATVESRFDEEVAQPTQPPPAGAPIPATPSSVSWVRRLAVGLFLVTLAILVIIVWPEVQQRWATGENRGT